MDIHTFAKELVQDMGEKIRAAQKEGFRIRYKGGDPKDIITSVDTEVNDMLIARIKEVFPEHSIYSEEGGVPLDSEYLWVLDPIDGSSNFSRGIPHFAICVGLLHKGVPIVGAIYNPITNELFSFEKGKGAYVNGEEVKVSSCEDLSLTKVLFHTGRKEALREWGGESYKRLMGAVKKTSNFSSSSLDTCFVGAGRVEGNIYGTMSTLDIASAIGFVLEAGGVVAGEDGKDIVLSKEPQKVYVANNRKILKELIELLEV